MTRGPFVGRRRRCTRDRLVRAVLAPHHAEDAELGVRRRAAEVRFEDAAYSSVGELVLLDERAGDRRGRRGSWRERRWRSGASRIGSSGKRAEDPWERPGWRSADRDHRASGVLSPSAMRACVVVFPGSNADAELVHTLRDVCGAPTTVVWHTDTELPAGTDLVAIPGGFSYGDYLRTGAIAKVSPIVARDPRARRTAAGTCSAICNGFQILTEAGLFRARSRATRSSALRVRRLAREGDGRRGPSRRSRGRSGASRSRTARGATRRREDTLKALEDGDRIGLRYCTRERRDRRAPPTRTARCDRSPGSTAAPRKNVFGLMPHPERMSEAILGGADGRALFESILAV